jgi:hypothetical protein
VGPLDCRIGKDSIYGVIGEWLTSEALVRSCTSRAASRRFGGVKPPLVLR